MPQYSGMWTLSQVSQAVKNQTWTGLPPSVVEYLVVAGGGGGQTGGGGGAGGLLAGYAGITSGSSYTVTVGGGGSNGGGGASVRGVTGTSSVFGDITATGGGGGAAYSTNTSGLSGGSGGGGYSGSAGSGTSGQGNAGASSGAVTTATAGGGGAGTIGSIPTTAPLGGNGGAGIASAISGTVTTYAGGGGGGANGSGVARSSGGVGGGGSGCIGGDALNTTGTVNTGGGGGGGFNVNSDGKSGGSGIVVIRYPGTTQFFTGGTLSYANGYISHTFYANGTLVPIAGTLYANPDYQIARSLRFNSADTAYLSRTPASATNRKTFTWSGWVKRSALPAAGVPIFSTEGTPYSQYLCFGGTDMTALTTDALCFFSPVSGSAFSVQSANVYRDVSAWYHIVCAVDTTQQTAANRVRLYVNGSEVSYGSSTYPAQNLDTYINSTGVTNIGSTAAAYFRGYITEVNFIDGQALTPSSFGWTNPATGVWAPLDFVGTYGTNGFNLNFSDNTNTTAATLGADSSGNGNNFTPNNFSVTAGAGNDSLVDTPTLYGTDTGVGGEVRGNYCTLNPLTTTAGTYTQGNLRYVGASNYRRTNSTVSVATGQWYWEVTLGNAPYSPRGVGSQYNAFGFGLSTVFNSTTNPNSVTDALILADNSYYKNFSGAWTDTSVDFSSGDVLSIAVDLDGNTFTLRRNNTSLVTGTIGGTVGRELTPIIISYDGTQGVMDCNFGQRPFAYTAPSGYKALNTQNLPTPTIGATSATLANKFFGVNTWAGTGATQVIGNAGFQPDWIWIKSRSASASHYLVDSVRGLANYLFTDSTSAEYAFSPNDQVTSLNASGFTLGVDTNGGTNYPTRTFVGWQWRASNATAVTNTSGSITSSVSANPTSGFSVVTWAGTGTAATIGHGLGTALSMITVKQRNGVNNWPTWHTGLPGGSGYYVYLDLTNALGTSTTVFNGTNPTSSVFSVGTNSLTNGSAGTYVAYCFAEVAGYSKFGSYTGNGAANGPLAHTGFRPAFVMIKRAVGGSGSWYMEDSTRDTYNPTGLDIEANANAAEAANSPTFDFLSNGFKLRTTYAGFNTNGDTYIYMAFASNPFKYSLAR